MKNSHSLILSVVLATLPFVAAQAGNVYKWVDDQGVVHYTDQKPHQREAQAISVRVPSQGAATEDDPAAAVEALNRKQEAKELGQRQAAETEQESQYKKSLCDNARQNLEVIQNNARIKVDEKGSQRYLTPEEILEKRDGYEKTIKANC